MATKENTPTPQNTNLKYWELFRKVPDNACKPILDGKLKGKTDINPVWRLKVLTEHFGPIGIGWHYETAERWTDSANGELIANVRIKLFIHPEGSTAWAPIEGIGGSKISGYGKGNCDDEAWKMATTDAISVACKSLGIAADIYFAKDAKGADPWSKYDKQAGAAAAPQQGIPVPPQMAPPAPQAYPQGGWPQAAPAAPQAPAPAPAQPAQNPYASQAYAEAVDHLCNFDKGTPSHQQTLNEQIGKLSAAGFRVFDPGFIANLTEDAQARREGRAPSYQ